MSSSPSGSQSPRRGYPTEHALTPDVVILWATGTLLLLAGLFLRPLLTLVVLMRSPALRRARQRCSPFPGTLWSKLLRERDLLYHRHVQPNDPASPQALALASSVLAWNTLAMPSLRMSIVAPNQPEVEHHLRLVAALVSVSLDPTHVTTITDDPDAQRMVLEDVERITDAIVVHDRLFGRAISVSWAVFAVMVLRHAFPTATIDLHVTGDRTGTFWARSLAAQNGQGRFLHTPFPSTSVR